MFLKRYIWLLLTPLLALMPLSSCESVFDDMDADEETPTVWPPSKTIAISIRVVTVGDNSRADGDLVDGGLVDGDNTEQAIGKNGNYALFFDKNGKFFAFSFLTLGPDEDSSDEDTSDYIEKTYISIINANELGKDPFDNLPSHCLLVLNATNLFPDFLKFTTETTVNDVLETIWKDSDPRKIGRNGDLFVMTNSTYLDPSTGTSVTLSKINKDMIYDAKDPANMSLYPVGDKQYTAPVLTVFVERVTSKFSFRVADVEPEDDGSYLYTVKGQQLIVFNSFAVADGSPTYDAVDWRVAITGWNVNGLETQSHLFKRLNEKTSYFSNWSWNNPEMHRSYWSEDPHYAGSYPLQYRPSANVKNVNCYEDFAKQGTNQLKNYSYNQLGLDTMALNKNLYVPENTYNYEALKDNLDKRANVLAGTHLIVGGRLQTKFNGQYADNDLYRDREGFYYKNQSDCYKVLVYGLHNSLESQTKMRYVYYDWSGKNPSLHGKVFFASTSGVNYLYLDNNIVTNSMISTWGDDFLQEGIIKGGDGKRMPWPLTRTLSIKTAGGTVIRILDESGKDVRAATDDDVKSILFEWMGAIDHYNEGRMYYTAPAILSNTAFTSDKEKICGVVRNNWYTYRLDDVTQLGTPVDDIDQPIIPDPTSNNDQLNVKVEILDWHKVTTHYPILP